MCPGRRGEFLSPARLGHCTDKRLPPILACALPPCAAASSPSSVSLSFCRRSRLLSPLSISNLSKSVLSPSLSPHRLAFDPFVLFSLCLSLALLCLSSLICVSVSQSRCLFCCPTLTPVFPHLFVLSFICPHVLFVLVFPLQIFMPLGIYTPDVIILSLLSGLSILQPFPLLFFFVSGLSLFSLS